MQHRYLNKISFSSSEKQQWVC